MLRHQLMMIAVMIEMSHSEDPTPDCVRISSQSESFQLTFLLYSQESPVSFYWTRWTSHHVLNQCFITTDKTLISSYLSLCDHLREPETLLHFNLSLVLKYDSRVCEDKSTSEEEEEVCKTGQKELRRKRALFLLPGTLWCGRGSNANHYQQLGMFENADRCCREHDHCENIIGAFSVNFGVFNPTLFTLSHCDCDYRFKQCLLAGNDTVSNMVGYSFFNILKIRCFELDQKIRCIQFNWFGTCTSFQAAPVAVLKDSIPYNSTNQNNSSNDITDLSSKGERMKSHENEHSSSKSTQLRLQKEPKNCVSVKHAKQDTLQLSPRSRKKCDRKKKTQKAKARPPMKRRTSPKNKAKTKTLKRTSQARVTPSSLSARQTLLKTSTTTSKPTATKPGVQKKNNKRKSLRRRALQSRKSKKSNSQSSPSRASRGDHHRHRGKNTSRR